MEMVTEWNERRTLKMTAKTRINFLVIAVSISLAILGLTSSAANTEILAVGTIAHSEQFNGPATLTVRLLTLKPGEALPWHYHPGHAFNVVKSGTLTVEDGCGAVQTLTPGQAFEMGRHVHRVRNLGTTDVSIVNTFLVPNGKQATVEIPGNERRCGPPPDAEEPVTAAQLTSRLSK
jgi:quercetin dioxygenase-like cupin family protein